MHSRREKHAGISRNGQQNMTIIGIKLEEVFSFKTRKDLKGVRWGYPVRWRYPYATRRLNPIALRKTKIVCNFGLSECNRVN